MVFFPSTTARLNFIADNNSTTLNRDYKKQTFDNMSDCSVIGMTSAATLQAELCKSHPTWDVRVGPPGTGKIVKHIHWYFGNQDRKDAFLHPNLIPIQPWNHLTIEEFNSTSADLWFVE